MDLYFLRMDTGYDAVMLAVMDEEGTYNVYRVDEEEQADAPICLFREKDPEQLRDHVRKWCQSHLSQDEKMVALNVKDELESIERLKQYLHDENIPYERKQQTFYVSQGALSKVERVLNDYGFGA